MKTLFSALAFLLFSTCGFTQDTLKPFSEASKWGYKNSKGVVIIPKYDQVNEFSEGFASVKLMGRWGFIDQTGKEITAFKYDPLMDHKDCANYCFSDGMAPVRSAGKWGFIDHTGKEVIPLIYSYAYNFQKGSASVSTIDNKTLYINHAGKSILTKAYTSVFPFYNDRALVEFKGMFGYIGRSGKEVIPLKFKYANDFSEGFASVTMDTANYFFIDTTGKEISSDRYDACLRFTEGLGLVVKNRKWGFIDTKGKVVIPLEYDRGFNFEDGSALMIIEGKAGLIDMTGKKLTPFKYEDDDQFHMFSVFHDGMIALKLNGKFGYLDAKTGKEVIPFKYERAWVFNQGKARVFYKGKWWIIDKKGKEVLDKDQ